MTNNLYEQVAPLMDFAFLQRKWFEGHFKNVSKKYGISLTELSVCLVLYLNPKIQSARDVEKYTELKRGIISVCVEHLSCKKFLKQEPVENDRRMKKLVLTPKAEPMLEESSQIINDYLKRVFGYVNKDELEICCRVFCLMKQELVKMSDPDAGDEKDAGGASADEADNAAAGSVGANAGEKNFSEKKCHSGASGVSDIQEEGDLK